MREIFEKEYKRERERVREKVKKCENEKGSRERENSERVREKA